ncbi:DUF6888 family protein [uncultured Nostoc sp.]|uniref:DUF6888 family protein n=1 Tax=uncultured Nostoc sp. TaxID=340711 RepID=UPI0035CA1D39
MEPTAEQLRELYRVCVMASNLLQPINLVHFDERIKRIFVLVGETIEIEIYPNGRSIV